MLRARDSTAIGCSVAKSPISFTSSAAAWPLTSTLTVGSASSVARVSESIRAVSSVLHVAAREDARDEVEPVGRADLALAVVAGHAVLDHVDLLLRVAVDDGRHQAGQLDRVLLVLEQLQLQRLLQAFVGAEVELPPLDRQRADVVHDLAPEVVLARIGDVDLLLDRPHQALVGLLVL